MLSAAKVPLFFWAEVIGTACFTQNRSLVIPRHEKTPYHIINDRKPSVKFFHIFGSVCYIVKDGENLDKMKEKGDECIFVGYSNQSRAYIVFNKRTRVIMESIHVNFDELPQMASAHNSSDPAPTCQMMASVQIHSDPAPECQTMALEHDSLSPGRKCQENVVSKSSAVSVADAPNQRQQLTTPLNNHTTPVPTCQTPPIATTVRSSKNINQAKPHAENDQVADDEFINIFSTPVQDQGETSSRHVDSSNMHTFYQRYPVSRTEPKNIKEAMADSAWIESMQEELHQFDRLDVWELVDRPLCINMASAHNSSDPVPECTTLNELDLLFSPMFDELLNGSSKVVSKSSVVSAADESIQRQQQPTTPLNNHTTPVPTCQTPPITTTVRSSENIHQSEPHAKNDQVAEDEFINIFSTPGRWTKDHPLEQVIGNPSQSVRTRRQLESDAEMCMFALTVSRTEPKNIKEAMADFAWIESMQEELYQFDRLDVWELVDRPLSTNVINLKWLWKNKRDEENTVIRNKSRL
nr:retrovirus-related Pol polyprotein from transposon TNT 1-94 [Tanacetum cinerariifolium]